MMMICVVDGLGGGLGSRVIQGLRDVDAGGNTVIGLGLDRVSAEAMKRAGATSIETTPSIIHSLLHGADVIVGSLNLLMPGTMFGQVTPVLVRAMLKSPAKKILLPINNRKVEVVGVEARTLELLIDQAIQRIVSLVKTM